MHWLPPEIANKEYYSKKVDVWSFGCFAYELATGGPPNNNAKTNADIIDHILNEEPALIPARWSTTFRDFVSKCLVKDPCQRQHICQLLKHDFLRDIDQ